MPARGVGWLLLLSSVLVQVLSVENNLLTLYVPITTYSTTPFRQCKFVLITFLSGGKVKRFCWINVQHHFLQMNTILRWRRGVFEPIFSVHLRFIQITNELRQTEIFDKFFCVSACESDTQAE